MGVLLLIGLDVAVTLGVTVKALGAVRRSVEQIGIRRSDWSTTVVADPGPPIESLP